MTIEQLIATTPISTFEFNHEMVGHFSKWIKGTFGDRKFEVYPGVYQNSDEFREFRFRLFKELEPIVSEVNSLEFSTATKLLGEMGQGCSHVLLPFNNAEILRSDFKLTKPTEVDWLILERILDKLLQVAELQSISVKDKSSSGYPYFIKGVGFKLSTCNQVFKEIHSVFESCYQRDIVAIQKKMGNLPYYSHGVRYQLDGISFKNGRASLNKERRWFSPEFIASDGKTGASGTMDYTVYDEKGNIDKRFLSARVRSMYALSYNYNCVLQVLNNYLMDGLYKVAPEVVYHTPEQTVTELGGFNEQEFITIDYGNYGETIPGQVVEMLAHKLDKKIRGLGNFIRLTYNAPRIVRGYIRNENNPIILNEGDPFRTVKSGLCSGNGLVAFLGKLCAVWDGAIVMRKMVGRTFNLEKHLNNHYSAYKRKTSSDDGISKFYDSVMEQEYINQIQELSIFKTSITSSPEFLGYLYLRDYVTRDLAKLVEHLTNFERGMKSKMFFELGIGCSISEYENNRFFSKVYPILVRAFKSLKIDLNDYRARARTLATPTAIFLANPDSVFYKLDPALVNTDIYKQFFSNVSKEYITRWFGGLNA